MQQRVKEAMSHATIKQTYGARTMQKQQQIQQRRHSQMGASPIPFSVRPHIGQERSEKWIADKSMDGILSSAVRVKKTP